MARAEVRLQAEDCRHGRWCNPPCFAELLRIERNDTACLRIRRRPGKSADAHQSRKQGDAFLAEIEFSWKRHGFSVAQQGQGIPGHIETVEQKMRRQNTLAGAF